MLLICTTCNSHKYEVLNVDKTEKEFIFTLKCKGKCKEVTKLYLDKK